MAADATCVIRLRLVVPLFVLSLALAAGIVWVSLAGPRLAAVPLVVAAAALVWVAVSLPKVVERPLALLVARLQPDREDGADPADVADLLGRGDEVGALAGAIVDHVAMAEDLAARNADLAADLSTAVADATRRGLVLVRRLQDRLDGIRADGGAVGPEDVEEIARVAARLQRQAEDLLVVADDAPMSDADAAPMGLAAVAGLAAAVDEGDGRVVVNVVDDRVIVGWAARPLAQLLAALVDNALRYSPPASRVSVRTMAVGDGTVISIRDQGLGMDPDGMAAANATLAAPGRFGAAQPRQLGLFVCAVIARRLGAQVELRVPVEGRGVEALVHVPATLEEGAGATPLPPRMDRATAARLTATREGLAPASPVPPSPEGVGHPAQVVVTPPDAGANQQPTGEEGTQGPAFQLPRRRRWRRRESAPSGWSMRMPADARGTAPAEPTGSAVPGPASAVPEPASAVTGAAPTVPGPTPAVTGPAPAEPAGSAVPGPAPVVPDGRPAIAAQPAGVPPAAREANAEPTAEGSADAVVAEMSAMLGGLREDSGSAAAESDRRPSPTMLGRLFADQASGG